MKNWQATLQVCDDVLVSLSGKFNLVGLYTADIGIPIDPTLIPQLAFFFDVSGDLPDRPEKIDLQITFPGGESRQITVDAPLPAGPPLQGRTKWHIRAPMLAQNIVLKPGRITARIKHRGEELEVHGAWVVLPSHPVDPAVPLKGGNDTPGFRVKSEEPKGP